MLFIGDIHGLYKPYFYLLKVKGHPESIQLGDFGMGFPGKQNEIDDKEIEKKLSDFPQHKFIRGNHDKPDICRASPRYLGDYGYHESSDIFFLSGGLSIDKDFRNLSYVIFERGVTWWEDEELSYDELSVAIEQYGRVKPRIMISHECPYELIDFVGAPHMQAQAKKHGRSRTSMALQTMYETHQPEIWLFGHYHTRNTFKTKKTRFEALDMMRGTTGRNWIKKCSFELPDVSWSG